MQKLTIDQAFSLSKQLCDAQKYDDAALLLLQILAAKDDLRPVLETLGLTFLSAEKLGLAICVAERLIALNPDTVSDYQNALSLYKRALIAHRAEALSAPDLTRSSDTSRTASGPDPSATAPAQVIVLCGGLSARWNGYQGVKNKHLVRVNGEVLLARTVALVRKHHLHSLTVLVPAGESAAYAEQVPSEVLIKTVPAPPSGVVTPAWKYLSSEAFCARGQDTIILLGDVWFSEDAMHRIFTHQTGPWTAFGRHRASALTGCPYGEIFALRFADPDWHFETVKLLDLLYKAHLCTESASGWAVLQMINDENPNIRSPGKSFVCIDDFTEDFDLPEDFDRWVRNFAELKEPIKGPHF